MQLRQHQPLQHLESAALQDFLTGLGNRRAFEADLRAERVRAVRHGQPFGLMLLDLDGLKRVNDSLGHEAGDALLQGFGDRLRRGMRAEDHCYRLGRDEFAVLPHTPVTSGDTIDRRVRDLMQGLQGEFVGVDVSAGLAFYPEEHTDVTELIRLADERMYAMKTQHHSGTVSRIGLA